MPAFSDTENPPCAMASRTVVSFLPLFKINSTYQLSKFVFLLGLSQHHAALYASPPSLSF